MFAPRLSDEVLAHICWAQLASPPKTPTIASGVTVLTGGQCAGKTTMKGALAELGFPIISESIREIFEEGVGRNFSPQSLKRALPEIVETSLSRHIESIVAAAQSGKSTVSDRGLGDLLGLMMGLYAAAATPKYLRRIIPLVTGDSDYWEYLKEQDLAPLRQELGRQIKNLREWAHTIKYDRVLWLESMPRYQHDGFRAEGRFVRTAAALFVKNAWRLLGYNPEPVPALYGQLSRRVDLVRDRIEGCGDADLTFY